MTVPTGRTPLLVAILLILALGWAVVTFGAANLHHRYLFILLLIPAGLTASLTLPKGWLGRPKLWGLVLVGAYLLTRLAYSPTLEVRGYVLAGIGWIALLAAFRVADSRGQGDRIPAVGVLIWGLLLLGTAEAVYGLAQVLGRFETIGSYVRLYPEIATGTFVNRNHFAGFLNMSVALGLGALHGRNAAHRREPALERYSRSWVVIMVLALMGLAMVLSQSRGGILTLLLMVGFTSALLVLKRRRGARHGLSGLAPGIVVLTILALGLSLGLEAVFERFGRMEEGEKRLAVYGDTLDLIADHPLLGVGPDMYRWRFRRYQSEQLGLRYDQAHNDYLQAAAEWGIPLAIGLWAFVLWRFFRALFHFFDSRDARTQGIALGAAAAIFTILVHSLVDFNLQIPANLATFAVVLALAWGLEDRRGSVER